MLIVNDYNSINKKSVNALAAVSKKKSVAAQDVVSFWNEYGVLIPSKEEIRRLNKLVKEGKIK